MSVFDYGLLLASPPRDVVVSMTDEMYQYGNRWELRGSDDLWKGGLPELNFACGYALVHQAGPAGIEGWFSEERLWIRPDPDSRSATHHRSASPGDVERTLKGVAPEVIAYAVLTGHPVGVSADRPVRRWVNWRGLGGWWSRAAVVLGGLLMTGAAAAWAVAGRRSVLVKAGVCPRCRYDLRGSAGPACPECGEALTLYEQTIVAALPPARSAG
jgi:hypothetical protein